ncbi:MAG TPA: hypothetical protein VM779_05845 [Thermoanaerobaculia bacterium]|nr:hypothetical protein [Thermoanaerobaculia bacterium]
MSYDLAIMALEGLAKSPVELRVGAGEVVIQGSPASFKELARLFLLLGGGHMEDDFELQPGVHMAADSPRLRLTVSTE